MQSTPGSAKRADGNFPWRRRKRALPIPLREFSGAAELEDRTHDHFLKLWLLLNGDPHEAAIATVPAQEVVGNCGSLDRIRRGTWQRC